jgi:hypothetical protein
MFLSVHGPGAKQPASQLTGGLATLLPRLPVSAPRSH